MGLPKPTSYCIVHFEVTEWIKKLDNVLLGDDSNGGLVSIVNTMKEVCSQVKEDRKKSPWPILIPVISVVVLNVIGIAFLFGTFNGKLTALETTVAEIRKDQLERKNAGSIEYRGIHR